MKITGSGAAIVSPPLFEKKLKMLLYVLLPDQSKSFNRANGAYDGDTRTSYLLTYKIGTQLEGLGEFEGKPSTSNLLTAGKTATF